MKSIWVVVVTVTLASVSGELLARGGRGGGGGGARAGGGGGMSRPTAHAPSFSRPSGMGGGGGGERYGGGGAGIGTRPAGGGNGAGFGNRPGGGGGFAPGARPGGGEGERFAGGGFTPGARPGGGEGAAIGTRPGGVGGFTPGTRPGGEGAGIGTRPGGVGGIAAGNRPADGFRPGAGNTANWANRTGDNNFANRNNFNNRNFNNFSNNNINVNGAGRYGGWYHGNWHANAGWNGGGYRPWGWGWGGSGFGWGVGAGLATAGLVAAVSPWSWGYYGYSNPYWNGGGDTYINYSQPIVAAAPLDPGLSLAADDALGPDPAAVADDAPAPAPADVAADSGPTTDQDQAMAIFEGARGQFTAGDYAGALAAIDNAIKLLPGDPVLHEFRALCLFAQGEYQQSAAAIYAVLSGGPGWDWTTESSLYPSVMVYTKQLRALEKYSQDHPDAADARFLLAYQYLLTGHNDAASAELKQVVALEPGDALSAQLLKSISPAADGAAPGPAPAQPPAPAGRPVDARALVGDWTASRPDGSKVEMDLTPTKEFTWRFAQGGKPQELKGTYTLADNYLVLKASQQNALVGQVGLLAANQLSFRLADDNPADPGLVFKK